MLSPARSAWCTKKLNSIGTLIQRTTTEAPQGHMYYIGLDVHKKTISYCVKDASGQVHQEGQIGATRWELDGWMKTLPQPWTVAMEATIFTGWIYDHLLPHAQQVKVAHPLMLRAIAAAKKKNDRIDAGKIADCLRCDFLPECHMASTAIRDRRRTLRYRRIRPGQFPTAGPFAGGANQTPQDRSWSRTDHGADLGTGNGRGFAFPLDPRSHQLLRALR